MTNPINSVSSTYSPAQPVSIPLAEKRPLTQEELNSDAWVKIDVNQPHWKQLEGVKEMFFQNTGANSKIGEDLRAMDQEMEKLADQFFEGKMDEDGLAAAFQRLADRFIGICKEKQYPFQALKGFDEAELSVAYDHFRASILKSAVAHNQAEGRGHVTGEMNNQRNWHYYNADYYYKSESAIAAITGKAEEMAASKGFDRFQIPDYQALGKNSCYNFNSAVSGEGDYIPGGLRALEPKWILDFDMVPPEDFRWFYQSGGNGGMEGVPLSISDGLTTEHMDYSKFDPENPLTATVWAMLGEKRISADILFQHTATDQKNLADLLRFTPSSKKELAEVNKFLKNFQVAPKGYLQRMQADRRMNLRV